MSDETKIRNMLYCAFILALAAFAGVTVAGEMAWKRLRRMVAR